MAPHLTPCRCRYVMRGRPETVPVADDRLPSAGCPTDPTAPLVPLCASLQNQRLLAALVNAPLT